MATPMRLGVLSSGVGMRQLLRCPSGRHCVREGGGRFLTLSSFDNPRPRRQSKLLWLLAVGGAGVTINYVWPEYTNHATVKAYRMLPLAALSRLAGRIANREIPEGWRCRVLGWYARMFGVDISEAADEDLTHYRSLGEFFRRSLKPGVRPVDAHYSLTCPSDGKLLHFGMVENGRLEQVKGVTYSLKDFLGPLTWIQSNQLVEDVKFLSDENYYDNLEIRPGHDLYYFVMYLAPGDYHGFHSSADWTIKYRRHFPGNLLSVNPWIAERVPGLFNYNERVVYAGEWQHGFFSYIPIGATNVGSIQVFCDQELETNKVTNNGNNYIDKSFCDEDGSGLWIQKGERFGEFNMGSTVVLVFEAPKQFQFTCEHGQIVKCGMAIGNSLENEKSGTEDRGHA